MDGSIVNWIEFKVLSLHCYRERMIHDAMTKVILRRLAHNCHTFTV